VFAADEIDIHLPSIKAYGYQGAIADWFNTIKNIVVIREFLLLFFVSHHVAITKQVAFQKFK
jgi:hypothetical protein